MVKDANGCTASSVTTLTTTSTVSFSTFTKTNIGCSGSPLGTIHAIAANGNPTYQYSLNGAAYVASGNFVGLTSGTYTVTAKDASNCTVSSVVTIFSSNILTITSIIHTNSNCFSPGSGSVTITGTANVTPVYYYLNGSSNTTGIFTGLSAGTYNLSFYDANGCHKDSFVTITSPPPMFFTNAVVIPVPCFGGTGSISLNGAGGVAPYTYSINASAYGGIHSWSNLLAGTYTIFEKDANGCLHDTIITLLDPPKILFNGLSIVNAACNGAPTGSISFTASGGISPYQYALNAGAWGTISTFNNLSVGVYVIHIKDSSNCIQDTTIIINNDGNFFINSVQKVSPLCHGGSTGNITLTDQGGTTPYQYALNSGSFSALNSFTGLSAGTYTLHTKDNAGCSRDSIIILSEPLAISFSNFSITPINCFGASSGIITTSALGGVAPYQYQIDLGGYSSNNTFSNIAPGNHTVSIHDANGCLKDTTVFINRPSPILFSAINIVSPGCLGASTGLISFTGTGGIAPYTYAVDAGAYTSNGTFSNLSTGIHTLHIKDNNGCIKDSILSLVLDPIISLSTLSYTSVICLGAANGSINIVGNSINNPLTYTFNGANPLSSGIQTGLTAGNYSIHVEDMIGCYIDTVVSITTAPPIILNTIINTSPSCNNSINGNIVVNANGGLGPLKYAFNTSSYNASNVLTPIGIGTYTVHVKDSLFCQKDTVITVTGPQAIIVNSLITTSPFCSNSTDGSITINVSGGQAPYSYGINTSLFTSNNVFTNLDQGIYTIHIIDFNGCTKDTLVVLNAASYMNFNNIFVQNVTCKYGNDGLIAVSVTGGIAPYTYTINSIPNGTSSSFAALGIGSYTIAVTDNIGCMEDTVVTVSEPLLPVTALLLGTTPNKCKGDSIGTITAGASGGTSPYTYSINGINYQSSGFFSGLPANTYLLRAKDANGCIDDTLVFVTEPDTTLQLLLVGIKDQSCKNVNDGAITVTSAYGINPLQFSLNGTSIGVSKYYPNLSPGDYTVEVIDSIGCKSTGKYYVKPSDRRPYIYLDSLLTVVCSGDYTGYLDWHAEECFPPYHYFLNSIAYGGTSDANNLTNTSYHIEVYDTLGCYGDTTVVLQSFNVVDVQVNSTPASCDGIGDDGKAMAIPIGGIGPYSYAWSGSPLTGSVVSNLNYGLQYVYIKDSLGCTDSTQFVVEYNPCCEVNLPNAFSPNNDSRNDIFRVIRYGRISFISLEVYNRWGQMVFRTTDITDGWDGKFHGTDCELDTYFYIARYKCPLHNDVELLKGDVILVR